MSTTRRWYAGQSFSIDDMHFRVVAGKKGPDDLRLDQLVDGKWVAVRMAVGGMMADFFFENEEVLYPPPAKGGKKYLDYVRDAARFGWERAEAALRVERAVKNMQPSLFDAMKDALRPVPDLGSEDER